MQRSLPTGTVTFLFTDVEGSTKLLHELGPERYAEELEQHRSVLREAFAGEGRAWSAENLYRRYTRVQPGLVRVDADEVTYPAHVILRYRLERAMIAGDLQPSELPAAWAAATRATGAAVRPVPPCGASGPRPAAGWD